MTFNLPEQMFRMALLRLKENDCENYFEIHAQLYKLWPGQIWSDGRTHLHQIEVVTTLSRSPQVSSTKSHQDTSFLNFCSFPTQPSDQCGFYGYSICSQCKYRHYHHDTNIHEHSCECHRLVNGCRLVPVSTDFL